jgi:hypothetical protein
VLLRTSRLRTPTHQLSIFAWETRRAWSMEHGDHLI